MTLRDHNAARLAAARAKYPNVPQHALYTKKMKASTANDLTQAVIDYITLAGGWATRVSTEGRYIESLGKRIPSSVKRGTPDIIGVLFGRFLGIEIKTGKDKMSGYQKLVQEDITRAGGLYIIGRDFQQIEQELKDSL